MLRKIFPNIQQVEPNTSDSYEFDILNIYENINMDIQLFFTLMLLILALRNLFNVRKWCKEKKVKPNKLYCINSNALLIIICILSYFPFFIYKKGEKMNFRCFVLIISFLTLGRMVYQSDTIWYHIHGCNFSLIVYSFFQVVEAFFLDLLLMVITINW